MLLINIIVLKVPVKNQYLNFRAGFILFFNENFFDNTELDEQNKKSFFLFEYYW